MKISIEPVESKSLMYPLLYQYLDGSVYIVYHNVGMLNATHLMTGERILINVPQALAENRGRLITSVTLEV